MLAIEPIQGGTIKEQFPSCNGDYMRQLPLCNQNIEINTKICFVSSSVRVLQCNVNKWLSSSVLFKDIQHCETLLSSPHSLINYSKLEE